MVPRGTEIQHSASLGTDPPKQTAIQQFVLSPLALEILISHHS